ncbi:SDR family NAD(P)-dependent oxidoreductase [Pseudonocardia oroxyli]|uniref:SDR family NAD(P)-dependent oxidoreductase n=1 Tax=Pseudonocardia oroxyli TaxID=366584 RepID=UPI001FE17AE7|nr:SDR family NAD(P)-dependent oxidoreductase [Pseudonocardia oroxyli]
MSNRGLGRAFAEALVERGAKVDATARRPETVDLAGVEVLPLDVTDPASAAAAAEAAPDVTLLVNNAGISTGQGLLTGDLAEIRREMEVHHFGTLNVTRAFAPGLKGLVNVLSALSWFSFPGRSPRPSSPDSRSMPSSATRSRSWPTSGAPRARRPCRIPGSSPCRERR